MKELQIIGSNHFDTWTAHRTACRGIVVCDEQVLLSYEARKDQYGIPGGGLESDETLAECCIREIAEETGIVVSSEEAYLTMREYYEEYLYETHYFVCRAIGVTERKLTDREKKVGMVPRWINMEDAIAIFSKHQTYAETDEEKRGIYLREYMALNEYANRSRETHH